MVKSASNSLNTSYEDSVFIFDIQRGLIGSKKFKDSVYISPAAEPASAAQAPA